MMINSPWDAIRFVFQWETCSARLTHRLVHKTDNRPAKSTINRRLLWQYYNVTTGARRCVVIDVKAKVNYSDIRFLGTHCIHSEDRPWPKRSSVTRSGFVETGEISVTVGRLTEVLVCLSARARMPRAL